MAALYSENQKVMLIVLGVIVVILGAALRFHNLIDPTIGHIEIFTPGINLPYPPSDIPPRLTLLKSISGPIAGEPHPPGFYAFMFFWTKLFGVSPLAMRLPSVLFGIGSIGLVYVIGTLARDRLTGLIAAMFLALNGHHIYWSQIAKMMSMTCFLGLLSTLLLILITTRRKGQMVFYLFYVGVALTGLFTSVFFWPLFISQILWVLLTYIVNQKPLPGILRWQLLTFTLGTVLWSIAAYQSRRPSYIDSQSVLPGLTHFLQFGYLFEPDHWSIPSRSVPLFVTIFVVLISIFLLIVGLKSTKNTSPETELTFTVGPPRVVTISSGLVMFLVILIFAFLANEKEPQQTRLILYTSVIPLGVTIVDLLLCRYWSRIISFSGFFRLDRLASGYSSTLILFLGLIPISMLVGITPLIALYAPRNVISSMPFFLILLATGMATLLRRDKVWVILLVIVTVIHAYSVIYFKQKPLHPTDYKGLAQTWLPNINPDDLIFVQSGWPTTPIFYYVNADRYQFVGSQYIESVQKNPESRVWILAFEDWPDRYAMDKALVQYEMVESVDALRIRAELYTRKNRSVPEMNLQEGMGQARGLVK